MIFLIDCGHSGELLGEYLTKGKRSPTVPPGIHEGVFNRHVAALINEKMPEHTRILTPGPINTPLSARSKAINDLVKAGKNVCVVSIHANAAGKKGWNDASGFRVFYPRPWVKFAKESKRLAESVSSAMKNNQHIPYDERPIKSTGFHMVRVPKCPAILVETGFMTHVEDAVFMASWFGKQQIANSICEGLQAFGGIE